MLWASPGKGHGVLGELRLGLCVASDPAALEGFPKGLERWADTIPRVPSCCPLESLSSR